MRHPAEYYIKALILQSPDNTESRLLKAIDDAGFLAPVPNYLSSLQDELPDLPAVFSTSNRSDRASMQYLRDQEVYEHFFPSGDMAEATSYLRDPTKRMMVEQTLLARLDLKVAAKNLNRKYGWHLTEESMSLYKHYYWNIPLLTFDQWGRYLQDRSALYDRYMSLLQAPPELAYFHLRLDQTLESKNMIKRAQEIAYCTLEEVSLTPGTGANKIKAIGVLTKSLVECHTALSTSDMALSGVLKEFERFRMEHPALPPSDIMSVAPVGNFSGSGAALLPQMSNRGNG